MAKPATFWNEETSQAAIYGTDYSASLGFKHTFTTSSSQAVISTAGAYILTSDQNVCCIAGADPTATVPTTQAGSVAGTFTLTANVPKAVSLSAGKLAVIAVSTAGTLLIDGPVKRGDYD